MSNPVPKVSIIIPAYNAEKFIERCLDSVAAQTMPDFECIIVDDGSTDRTGAIADEYARNDSRFKVIHQPNGGVSVARQTGIDAATGVYTIQFDTDDWAEITILEDLVLAAENSDADMVMCDINIITQAGSTIWHQQPKSLETEVLCGQMMWQLCCGLWNKLIKREWYKELNIEFIKGPVSEDLLVCLSLLSHPIRVEYFPKALYNYDMTKNEASLTKKLNLPIARLKSLELFETNTDISKIQDYYDDAILQTAYDAFYLPRGNVPSFSSLFKKHLPSIRRAKGYPFRIKFAVLLRIYGIRIPIQHIKQIWMRLNIK